MSEWGWQTVSLRAGGPEGEARSLGGALRQTLAVAARRENEAMRRLSNQNACKGKVIVVVVLLLGHQPGFAESQDIEQLRQAADQE